MALVEAVLVYRSGKVGSEEPVPVAKTENPQVLRHLKDACLRDAVATAAMWNKVDPGLAAIYEADARRLEEILEFLVPPSEPQPELRVIDGGARQNQKEDLISEAEGPAPPKGDEQLRQKLNDK